MSNTRWQVSDVATATLANVDSGQASVAERWQAVGNGDGQVVASTSSRWRD